MRKWFIYIFLLPAFGWSADYSEADKLFTLKVKPIFSEKCNGCHGDDPEKIKGGYNMLTLESLLKGGETFGKEVLTPGNAEQSFLVDTIKWSDPDFEMPPKKNDRLNAEQIASVVEWINAGAPWPDEATQRSIREHESRQLITEAGMLIKTSGGMGDEWTYRRYQPDEVWAFLPVEKPELPTTKKNTRVFHSKFAIPSNPIDAFIERKLSKAGFPPAPSADPRILIRRASFDLIGLPPDPSEVDSFVEKYQQNPAEAWSELLDQLLATPHYGERWAQHWLDVARYADTAGLSNDYERSNMWRYRDYVIRSFNRDKPYDQFIKEQIAGDELADRSLRKRIPDWNAYQIARQKGDQYSQKEAEWLVASSFLRMGPWDPAMVKPPAARQLYIDDVINGVGQTFLSTTMRCFKCHDHKFDPLPIGDYYAMYAAFSATQLAERNAPFLEDENRDNFDIDRPQTKRLVKYAREKTELLTTKRENAAREWYQQKNQPYINYKDRKNLPDEEKPPRHVGLSPEEQGELKVREQDVWIWNRRLERYSPLVQSVYNGPDPKFLNARKLRMDEKANQNWRPDSRILQGGALEAPGDPVKPGVLSALGISAQIPESLEGRRLAVADWIANPDNPLTARSFVNRIWQYHFGKAIAGNPNNFGVKGKKPTHPELLDWLASDFVENGWQVKRLHKMIMMSATYLQSTAHIDRYNLETKDPNNDLFAYFPVRRLSAEELRDSMLKVTGELNTEVGGLPIKPEINMEVALQPRMIQFSLAPAYLPNASPEDRNRRSIYAYRVRGMANPFLETFNQPNPNDSCEQRDSASVSPQAFTLLNSDMMTARSIAFAKRIEADSSTIEERVSRGIELAFGRPAQEGEIDKMTEYVNQMTAYHQKVVPDKKQYPTRITRELVEEFTGEPFTYEEILPVFENYSYDLQAADVGAGTRALADLGLVLFNSHEFVHLY